MLTKEFREAHPEVNWRQIEGMRHVLVHGYYNIDPMSLGTLLNAIFLRLSQKLRNCCPNMRMQNNI